ncbi:glycosyltransferase family 2 protein [Haladaptatus sp. NG-SE-30]
MTDEPVDVVIPYSPAHTPEQLRDRAVESVRSQTVPAEPIVVTDDGQRDVAWARNQGLDRSSNRFVAFLDADDYWKPEKLETQLTVLRDASAALCLTATERSDGTVADVAAETAIEFAANVFLGTVTSFTSSMLVDTEQTDARFDESFYRLEDHLFALEVAHDGGYCFVNDVLTHVEKHDDGFSATEDYQQKLRAKERFHEQALELFPVLARFSKRFLARAYYHHGRHCYFDGEYRTSLVFLARSFAKRPQLKPAGAFGLSLARYCGMYVLRQVVGRR